MDKEAILNREKHGRRNDLRRAYNQKRKGEREGANYSANESNKTTTSFFLCHNCNSHLLSNTSRISSWSVYKDVMDLPNFPFFFSCPSRFPIWCSGMPIFFKNAADEWRIMCGDGFLPVISFMWIAKSVCIQFLAVLVLMGTRSSHPRYGNK